MKVGDLVDFDFQDIYSGLVVFADEKIVKVLFFDLDLQFYTREELELCEWEIIS
tara:strand:- start:141 stop:302 length:162 start_codon:yes stop_codon:yes gene_type:complete